MDKFKEQLVLIENTNLYKMVKVITIIFLILGVAIMALGGAIPGLILLISAIVMFYMKRYLYVEYEYILTNGDIDIDAIYEIKARKRVISFNLKDITLLAPKNSKEYKDLYDKPSKIIKPIPKGVEQKIYIAVISKGINRVQLEFVPNKEFIDLCFLYNPKAVKKNV